MEQQRLETMTESHLKDFLSKLEIGTKVEININRNYDLSPNPNLQTVTLIPRKTPLDTPHKIIAIYQGPRDRSTHLQKREVVAFQTSHFHLELDYSEIEYAKRKC